MELRPLPAVTPALVAALEDADLPTDDLTEPGRSFFAAEDNGQVLGFAGYEIYGEDVLVRSVVVLPELRGRGVGHAVVAELLDTAYARGARTAYLFTTTAEAFFEREGFGRMERRSAPAAILATRQATGICATAPLLARPLASHG
jgi:N-acetylglutamate synthase-like GNAT family acetyltransferase